MLPPRDELHFHVVHRTDDFCRLSERGTEGKGRGSRKITVRCKAAGGAGAPADTDPEVRPPGVRRGRERAGAGAHASVCVIATDYGAAAAPHILCRT